MKKIGLLLLLTTIITIQLTILSSYNNMSEFVSVSGTSGVVVGKTNYVSMRVTFSIKNKAGFPAYIEFPNGTQKEVLGIHVFEVFLPKTEPERVTGPLIYHMSIYSKGVYVTDQCPMDIAIASNVDESFFTYNTGPHPNGEVIFYWFKIHGDATVSVTARGVTI